MADTWYYMYVQTYLASSVGKDCTQGEYIDVNVSDCCCVSDAILLPWTADKTW